MATLGENGIRAAYYLHLTGK